MNERTHFFVKIYISHFILERVDVSVVWERDGWKDIYSERGLLPISSSRWQGVQALTPPCKLVRDTSAQLCVPHLTVILCCSGTNCLFNYLTSVLRHKERDTILKSLSYHTMLTTSFYGWNPTLCPNGRNSTIIFHGPTLKSQLPGRTQLLTIMVGSNFNCLPQWQTTQLSVYIGPKSTPNWLFFKIFKFLGPSLPGMTSFTLQPHFLSEVYYDNCDCHILCAQV